VRGIPVEKGSGKVYRDLGYRDSESMPVKAQLAAKIAEIVQRRALTQTRAAEILGLAQPKVSPY
jgi:predicted XRE-type DNA-binding protein